ncbi:MAG: transglycosylase SLT domain-containing protein [Gammaproteobacteria bacterium]|nr:transglycosylase SLT domain-containing protein [Gammaproteobacteria bacterium]
MLKVTKPLVIASTSIILLFGSSLFANTAAYTKSQQLFLDAEKALKTNDITKFQQLKGQLSHYPLVSYLDFEYLSRNLSAKNKAQIDQFIQLQQHSPLASRLKFRYINSLVAKKEYGLFSQYYADAFESSKNAKLKCLYLSNQLKQGIKESIVFPEVKKLWTVAKSQPKECDPLFKQWKDAGQLTQKVGAERFNKAARKGPVSMINYLKRYLPKKQQYLAELWTKARKNPGVIANRRFFPQKDFKYQEAAIAVFAIKKLAWGDRDAAYKTWRSVQRHIIVPKELKDDAERTLFLAMATENKPWAHTWAKRNINRYLSDELISHWKLATFLRQEDWASVKEQYDLLPEQTQNTNQWKYWYSIASEKTGAKAVAIPILERLALQRDYYGYKAAAKLKKPLQLNHKSSVIPADVLSKVQGLSNVERAKELFALERYRDANREWRSLQNRLSSPVEFQAAAKIAHDWGWYNQGILTIAKAKVWDDTDIRFPTAFKEDYIVMGKKVDLEPEWLMGVTRQESAYGPYAVSGAGAYGLMQVLPSTAKIYSKKLGVKYSNRKDLFKPHTNIEMGSNYLKLRYDELDQNPIYASAAYNAGKHRIDKWKAFGRFPTEIWIEAIPYTETRDYIKKVMTYRAIYALKLNKKDTVFDYILNTETGG